MLQVLLDNVVVRPCVEGVQLRRHDYSVELLDFMCGALGTGGRDSMRVQRQRAAGVRNVRASSAVEKFKRRWQCLQQGLLQGDNDGDMFHHCGECWAAGKLRPACAKKIAQALIGTVFASLPAAPEAGKWAKACPMLAFLMVGWGCFGILPLVWRATFESAKERAAESKRRKSKVDADGVGDDPGLMSWGDIVSKRVVTVGAFLRDPRSMYVVIAFSIVMEPVQWLTQLFQQTTKLARDREQPPLAMSLSHETQSPVVHVLQYYAALLTGAHHRAVLLWGAGRCVGFLDWVQRHQDSAVLFRRLLLSASASIFRRIHKKFTSYPFAMAALGDSRLQSFEREAVAVRFTSVPACCLDAHFARVLREEHGLRDPSFVSDTRWQIFFEKWSAEIPVSVADIEFTHARNKRRAGHGCSGSTSWRTFSATHFLGEARLNHDAKLLQDTLAARTREPAASLDGASCDVVAVAGTGCGAHDASVASDVVVGFEARAGRHLNESNTRAWRAIDFFRSSEIQVARARGETRKWCTGDAWSHVHRLWKGLDDESRNHYEDLAGRSRATARLHRSERRQADAPSEHSEMSPLPLCHAADAHETTTMALCDELDGDTGRVAVAASSEEKLPLRSGEVKAVLMDTGLATMQKKWNEGTSTPVFRRKVVPDKVVRAPHCDSLCSTIAATRVKWMKTQLSHELGQLIAEDKRSQGKRTSSNRVLAFRAFREGFPMTSLFGAVCEGVARAGVVKAQQTWVFLDLIEPEACGDTCIGACLQLRHHPALPVPSPPCSDRRFEATTGMLCHATTDTLAAQVVCWAGSQKIAPDRVRVDSLLTSEIEGDKYWVTGERKAVIKLDEAPVDPAGDGDDCFLRNYVSTMPTESSVSWLVSECIPLSHDSCVLMWMGAGQGVGECQVSFVWGGLMSSALMWMRAGRSVYLFGALSVWWIGGVCSHVDGVRVDKLDFSGVVCSEWIGQDLISCG